MGLILARLAFIRFAEGCLLLLVPLLLVQASDGDKDFVISRVLNSLPLVFFGLVGGMIVDRLGATRVNRAALAAFVLPPLALLAVQLDYVPRDALIAASVAMSTITILLTTCSDRLVLDLVDRSDLAKYNATSILIERGCAVVLPPAIGVLAVWSMDAAVWVSAVIAGLGSIAMSVLSPSLPQGFSGLKLSWRSHLMQGFRTLAKNQFLLQLGLVITFVNAAEGIVLPYSIVYAHDVLHMNAAEIGLLFSVTAIGGVIAAIVARHVKGQRVLLLSLLTGSVFLNAVIYATIYFVNRKYMLFIGTSLVAFSTVFFAVSYRTLRQESIDKALFGVMSGALAFLVKAGVPFGILLGGLLTLRYGPQQIYITAFAAEITIGLAVLIWARHHMSRSADEAFI